MTDKEAEGVRTCVATNRPYGNEAWQSRQAKRLDLLHTLGGEGRPNAMKPQNYLRPRCDFPEQVTASCAAARSEAAFGVRRLSVNQNVNILRGSDLVRPTFLWCRGLDSR